MIATLRSWAGLGVAERGARTERREGEIALGRDQTHGAPVRRGGAAVECLAGLVWVTFEGDPADHVLAAGDALVVGRKGRLAMQALEPSRVRVVGRGQGLAASRQR
ncbi:DUF2917 domain-containing protein [Anaeromyxobacter oryzisoli]|uniref:DUF2917 domain-containing protein n=1 Tax=Anaeromyxobacter oryzisoli TaxID=2925408 RepID=UPI001F57D7F8|nr:DUF2917 domain-containing protein [Anaeromyxobacter sp. SG63]